MHETSSFVTLTYSGQHLPTDYSLSKRHLQTWLKRLRFVVDPIRIRYFACGEYGGKTLRPHYHCIVFGYDFPDRVPWRRSASGELCYRSELLERTWPLGHAEVGTFTPQSAGYVAGYSIKKITGDEAPNHYQRMNPDTGELHQVIPEFVLMSSRPGIGRSWYEENRVDAFPSDFLIIDGQRKRVPRYYKRLLDAENERVAVQVEHERKMRGKRPSHDKHWTRVLKREEYAEHMFKQRKPGGLDDDA